ncbi:hypothetical protein BGZ70_008555 [Mortierella alpina]|uniref:NAD(P)-binding protein n=1 Tax=Mortierella alpina TaxID=64518 RepID=A0A9P6M1G0_MORAP|nr:hypothetical protein BGZ70_008555 [Mortierella alpina]
MATTAGIAAAAVALPFLIHSLIAKANASARTARIPQTKERVVIIGASSGIGAELARIYAKRHAHIVLVARRIQLLEDLVKELAPMAGSIHALRGDVTLPDDVYKITIESLRFLQGGIDTLILCAGIISVLPFEELAGIDPAAPASPDSTTPGHEFDHLMPTDPSAACHAAARIMNVNYYAPFNLTAHFLPALTRTSVAGNLLVVSSMAGKLGAPTRSIYCASKHAVQGFFDALSMEVERTGVHVGIVSPGTVETDLRQSAVDLPQQESSSSATSSTSAQPKKVAGTKKGAMSAKACAEGIVQASDLRQHDVVMPWFYQASLALHIISPRLVRWLAKKKYGYV